MKPSWDDAPDWASWLAMDEDGIWHWYATEPEFEQADGCWYEIESDEDCMQIASDTPDESGIDWDYAFDTLEERP